MRLFPFRLPPDDGQRLESLKDRIRAAQLRVGVAINRELILLYWQIGREILVRHSPLKWGAKIIDRLSSDLKRSFHEMQRFSPRNLKYMRVFAEAWPTEQIVQQVAAQIRWFHNCVLLDKVKDLTGSSNAEFGRILRFASVLLDPSDL